MLKKIFALFLCACLTFSSAGTVFAEEENEGNYQIKKTERYEPDSLLILGDSIASGYGLDGYIAGENASPDSFGSKLCAEYDLTNETYRNFAVDGLTSADLLDSLQSGIYDDYLGCELIVISIGGNDLLGVLTDEETGIGSVIDISKLQTGELDLMNILMSTDFTALAENISSAVGEALDLYSQNLTSAINYIKRKSPETQIVMLTLYNPMNSGIELLDNLYATNIAAVNEIIKSSDSYIVSDVNEAFAASEQSLIQGDFTHPNSNGHQLIFETLSDTISENCVFYDSVKVSTTIVEVTPEKTHLKSYLAAIIICGAMMVIVIITGVVRFLIGRKKHH